MGETINDVYRRLFTQREPTCTRRPGASVKNTVLRFVRPILSVTISESTSIIARSPSSARSTSGGVILRGCFRLRFFVIHKFTKSENGSFQFEPDGLTNARGRKFSFDTFLRV
jgi:hypothetical protein